MIYCLGFKIRYLKNNPGKRVDLKTGVPTLEGLADSHLGYKRKFNKKITLTKIYLLKDKIC